jgi:hypothetical protein
LPRYFHGVSGGGSRIKVSGGAKFWMGSGTFRHFLKEEKVIRKSNTLSEMLKL